MKLLKRTKLNSKIFGLRKFVPVLVIAAITIVGVRVITASHAASINSVGASVNATGKTLQNWPCSNCILRIPPTYNPSKPTILLVALHGDEGTPTVIEPAWQPYTDKYNAILFAPHCPVNLGCSFSNGSGGMTSSWWGWLQYSSQYSGGWIGTQVSKIEAKYNINKSREYLTGWSGGADYLGDYALLHGNRFAAVAYVAGGVPYVQSCPAGKMAAYFLMGTNDFRYDSGQPGQVKQVFSRCGDPTTMVVLPGEDHTGTINAIGSQDYGDIIMKWFLAHPLVK